MGNGPLSSRGGAPAGRGRGGESGGRVLRAALPDGSTLDVAVIRRRGTSRVSIRVHADGSVTASVPWGSGEAGIRQAEGLLARKAAWLGRKVAERRAGADWYHPERLVAPAACGDGTGRRMALPLWGEAVDAREVLGPSAPLDATTPEEAEDLARLVMGLYAREASARLPEVAARAERDMGLHASRWTVRSMVSRWGSCTPARGTIRIAAQLAAYPPELLDLVVRHELAHLVERGHGPRFHALLERHRPRHRELQALLALHPYEARARLRA